MASLHDIEQMALRMAHSHINNYALPGLRSSLVGGPGKGTVRMFVASRDTHEHVIPHSHRYDFTCLVLSGQVTNRLYEEVTYGLETADAYVKTTLTYRGNPGAYDHMQARTPAGYTVSEAVYTEGQVYGMTHDQIHSISFKRDTTVLFLESAAVSQKSVILEPYVNGECIPTFKIEPWMFEKEGALL